MLVVLTGLAVVKIDSMELEKAIYNVKAVIVEKSNISASLKFVLSKLLFLVAFILKHITVVCSSHGRRSQNFTNSISYWGIRAKNKPRKLCLNKYSGNDHW